MNREDRALNSAEHQDEENNMSASQENTAMNRIKIKKIDFTEEDAQAAFDKLLPWL